jgi:hypothetical protein
MKSATLWKSDDEFFAIVQREPFRCLVGDFTEAVSPSRFS